MWWMPSSFIVRLPSRVRSSCTYNYSARAAHFEGLRRRPVHALDRRLTAGERVAEAGRRQRRPCAALDRRHADELAVEALLRGGHARVAVVVQVGLVGPRVEAAQEVDDRRGRGRVAVVAGQEPRLAFADAARGDRAADELDRDRLADAEVRAHVTGDERVDVAGDEDDVLDPVALDELQELLALDGIALPRVELRERVVRQLDRHHHHLVGHDLPGGPRGAERVLDEVHLRPAEERAGLEELGARRGDRVVARLVGAVLALVHDQEVDRAAEPQRAVDAVAADRRRVRHRLEERLVGGPLAGEGEAQLRREAAVLLAAGVVVLDLVVVPQHHGREARMDAPQRRVGAVEPVLRAVVVERDRGTLAGRADAAGAVGTDRARPGLLRLRVDVVAEAEHEVQVVVGHDVVGVVEAVREVLAGPEREAHGLLRVGRERGAEAADRPVRRARREAVEVLLVRAEARDARLQRMPAVAGRDDALRRDDPAEVAVARDLEVRADAPVDVVQARPQRDARGRRLARHDALGEPPAAGERRATAPAERLGREDGRSGGGAGGGDELAAGLHGALSPPWTTGAGRLSGWLDGVSKLP